MALELVYRAANKGKWSGAPAGSFPRPPPGTGLGPEGAQNRRFPILLPPTKNLKTHVAALDISLSSLLASGGLLVLPGTAHGQSTAIRKIFKLKK